MWSLKTVPLKNLFCETGMDKAERHAVINHLYLQLVLHPAMLCNATHAVPRSAVLCHVMPCCAVLYHPVLCCALPCCIMLCCAVLCHVVLCCAVLCCAVLCCAVLCFPGIMSTCLSVYTSSCAMPLLFIKKVMLLAIVARGLPL